MGNAVNDTLQRMNQGASVYSQKHRVDMDFVDVHQTYLDDMRISDSEELNETRKSLVKQLEVDIWSAQELKKQYPNLVAQAEGKTAELQRQASISGVEKMKEDFLGTQKRKSQAKLDKIKAKQEALYRSRHGQDAQIEIPTEEISVKQRSGKIHDSVTEFFNDTEQKRRSLNHTPEYFRLMYNDYLSIDDLQERRARQRADVQPGPVDITVNERTEGDQTIPELKLKRKNITIGTGNDALKGRSFEPDGFDAATGKVVVYYTGSGRPGSVEPGVGESIEQYLRKGYKVYQVDYRGYGDSGPGQGQGYTLSEAGFYQDGEAILKGVLADAGCDMNQVVLHGYSMGAAVASYVAAKVAQQNAKDYLGKEEVPAEKRLGGVVMDSPMASMTKAAQGFKGKFLGAIGGAVASHFAGDYSAEDHLGTLCKYQPDVPIVFVGGGSDDHLSLDKTGIAAKHDFVHSRGAHNTFSGDQGHEAAHLTGAAIDELTRQMSGAGQPAAVPPAGAPQ